LRSDAPPPFSADAALAVFSPADVALPASFPLLMWRFPLLSAADVALAASFPLLMWRLPLLFPADVALPASFPCC